MSDQRPNTTTDAGIPVPSDEYSLTAGPAGPVLLQDYYLNEKLAHFVRERVPDEAGRERAAEVRVHCFAGAATCAASASLLTWSGSKSQPTHSLSSACRS